MLATLLQQFGQYLGTQRGYSELTVASYLTDLKGMFGFLVEYSGNEISNINQLATIDLPTFRAWLAWRSSQNYQPRSTRRALSSVRSFFKYLKQHHNINNPNLDALVAPKITQQLPTTLTHNQIIELKTTLQQQATNNWEAARDLSLMLLLYSGGLRISEALQLDYQTWQHTTTHLTILGKGNKSRLVPIVGITKHAIDNYLNTCPYQFNSTAPLFYSQTGKRLNRRRFHHTLSQLQQTLGWLADFSAHSLRHSFATELLKNSNNIRYIQELLGHQSLSSTQIYTKITQQQLNQQYHKFHPLADIDNN